MSTVEVEAAGRALARWIAPYIAEELGLKEERVSESYDEQTCAIFVSTLGDVVLGNAEIFFGLLDQDGQVGSLALAEAIRVSGPRNIPAVLTTPLKRRARALSLPVPWREDVDGDRTLWVDSHGTGERMLDSVHAEQKRRAARRAA